MVQPVTHPLAIPHFEKDFGIANSSNPYLVFLVMDREKKTYGEAQIYIEECLKKMKVQELNKKYGI